MNHKATIYFDGGCRLGNPGEKYGSYEVRINGVVVARKIRHDFGRGTNNEAEFDSLILALNALELVCDLAKQPKKQIQLHVETDSTIVRNWIMRFEAKNLRIRGTTNLRTLAMWKYAMRCVNRLKEYQSFNVVWKSRKENVARFGH